jgi:hypothetical protein
MIRTDVLNIWRTAFDQDRRVVSALKLLDVLFEPESEALRQVLKADYTKPSTEPTNRLDGTPWTPDEIVMWKAAEQEESTQRAERFDQMLKELTEHRVWLEKHQRTFKDLRDRHIAHLEVHANEEGAFAYMPAERVFIGPRSFPYREGN